MPLPIRLALAALLGALPAWPAITTPALPPSTDLIFQTSGSWSPRYNVDAGMVMAYGIDASLPGRIRSWREHGYRVAVMTGVAWGRYGDFLRGDFDGREHWDDTQEGKNGKLFLHDGREIPYIVPTTAYGRYLSQGVGRALDAGAEAIYLEEPEFWAKAGWSKTFKAAWLAEYGSPWEEPDSSPDAQYRASKLKYRLYQRALQQVFDYVREWGKAHGKVIPCYVATHSVLNYGQWRIVSPESSLLDVGADGYIAQVWTGTARTPTVSDGVKAERTFESAFLEYGALQTIARSSGKPIWYLNDPIEDNPRHSWTDYRRNWESTLTASLMQPEVSRYEILPWPDRIFGAESRYPVSEPTQTTTGQEKSLIPPDYFAELQTVFHALGGVRGSHAQWQSAGTQGIGVLVSDTIMFQRAGPDASDDALGSFFGLALPLLTKGIPVEPVQIESSYAKPPAGRPPAASPLGSYRLLILSYEGQKPPSPVFHEKLADWVRRGGALVVVDDDRDPYHRAQEWWNSGGRRDKTPRLHLFETLHIADAAMPRPVRVGKGSVSFLARSPAALGHAAGGGQLVRDIARQAAQSVGLGWSESPALVLRRGPLLIAAGMGEGTTNAPAHLHGRYLDLFDAGQTLVEDVDLVNGSRRLLIDLDHVPQHNVAAAGARITGVLATARRTRFVQSGMRANMAGSTALISVLATTPPKRVTCDGKPVAATAITFDKGVLRLRLPSDEQERQVEILW
jgi:hypothetical protein